MSYNPPRQKPVVTGDPIEIELVFNLTRCGTCSFFWPENANRQPYGPYPTFDFDSNAPKTSPANAKQTAYPWVKGTTQTPSFPDPEVMDGCRKAPIMTIGINPNLTAFAPGRIGAAWSYPNFSNAGGTDLYAKYAFYYRYRSVYQERFDLGFMKAFLVKEGQILAPKAGVVVSAARPSDAPTYDVQVLYDGDTANTTISLKENLGEPRYILLFDTAAPDNRFSKGDVIAARLDVPAGKAVEIFQQQIGYYEQIVPVLQRFETFLSAQGHAGADLRVGEDVCQLDMVACASPHWGSLFLGGTNEAVATIVHNCVSKNAWAIKQLVQTQPAVLFLVGESSYDMFRDSFGKLIYPALPAKPADGAYTLLRETSDPANPRFIKFSTTIGGQKFDLSTRLVITPHFSYNINFLPQFRMSPDGWQQFAQKFSACAQFLRTDPRFKYVASQDNSYAAYQIAQDPAGALAALKQHYAPALSALQPSFYDPHAMMASVLEDLYNKKQLTYTVGTNSAPGYLTRGEGSCHFCVNKHWTFPLGCPYGKNLLPPPAVGFLDKVAAAMVKAGSSQ